MRNDFTSNYLAHHGILGQKWGKKNGTPYPLGASDHSAAEKKAGWRKSLTERDVKGLKNELKKKQHRSGEGQYLDNKVVRTIAESKNVVDARNRLKATKYDGPENDYNPMTDKTAINNAKKAFEKDMKEKYNPNNRQHEKILDYYIESEAEKLGLFDKAEKLNKAPSWDKAYDEYSDTIKKEIENVLGKHANDTIGDWHSSSRKYKDIVDDLIFEYFSNEEKKNQEG